MMRDMQTISTHDLQSNPERAMLLADKSPLLGKKNGKNAMLLLSYDLFDEVKKSVWLYELKEICKQSGKLAKKRGLAPKKLTSILADLKQERIKHAYRH
jgi:hypothetical protein